MEMEKECCKRRRDGFSRVVAHAQHARQHQPRRPDAGRRTRSARLPAVIRCAAEICKCKPITRNKLRPRPEPISAVLTLALFAILGVKTHALRHKLLPFIALLALMTCLSNVGLSCDDCGCHAPVAKKPTTQPTTSATGIAGGVAEDVFRFGVIADTQGLQYVEKLVTDLNAHNPELVVFPGDLVSTGSTNSWQAWKDRTDHFVGGLDRRLMVPGNHDLPVGGDAAWQQSFDWLPDSQTVGGVKGIDQMDYYYDFGNTRFISVTTDSQQNGAAGPPAAQVWLENLLADPSTQAKEHVFVYSHHPVTFNNYDRTGGTAGDWWRAMADSGLVDAVFVGHWHQYQPSQPDPHAHTWEVITGTGNSGFNGHAWQNQVGYSVVEVNGPDVMLRFYSDADNDGDFDDLLDEFAIVRSDPLPTGVVGYYGFHDSATNVDAAPQPLGKGNSGQYVGDATTVLGGVNGPALRLDGNGDFAHGGGIGDYNMALLRDMTLSIHANFDQLTEGDSANTLVSYSANVGGFTDREESVNHPFNLRIRDDKRLELFWEHNNNIQELFTSSVPAEVAAGEWHEYRVTRNANSGEVVFYVDGQQLGDTLYFTPATELPTGGAQGTLRIGIDFDRDDPAKLVGGFDGLIDEFVLWNEVTTETFVPPPLPCNLLGDVNGDCKIDEFDWQILRTNQRGDMTGLTSEQARALGDLNGDFANNHADFVIFKDAYESAHGAGSFKSIQQRTSVPEASTVQILMGVVALLVGLCKAIRF